MGKAASAAHVIDDNLASVKKQVAINLGFLTAGQAAIAVCQFLRLALLARYLGPIAYGEWNGALALVTLLAALADFGLPTIAVRDLSRGAETGRYLATAAILKLAISTLVLLLVVLAASLSARPEGDLVVYLLAIQMLVTSGISLVVCVFRANDQMGWEAALTASHALALLFVSVAMVFANASMTELAGAWLVVSGVVFALGILMLFERYEFSGLRFDASQARYLLHECWPVGLSVVAISVYYYFDRLLMTHENQIEAVGWYSAAYAPILCVVAFVGVLRNAFLPAHSRALVGTADPRPFLRFYGHVSLLLGVPVALGGVFLAEDGLRLVYGAAYVPGAFAFQILAVTGALMFLSSMYGAQLPILGGQRLLLADVCVGATVNVGLNLILIPVYSLDGAAVATLAAEGVVFLLMLYQNRGLLGPRELARFGRLPVIGGAVSLALYFVVEMAAPSIIAAFVSLGFYGLIAFRLHLGEVIHAFVRPGDRASLPFSSASER